MKHVTDTSFETDVLKAGGPGAGRFLGRVVRPLPADRSGARGPGQGPGGKVTVAKVNIDENPDTPSKYGVRGIPTLMIFKDGQVAATKIGALPKSKLYEWVESVV